MAVIVPGETELDIVNLNILYQNWKEVQLNEPSSLHVLGERKRAIDKSRKVDDVRFS